LLQPNRCSHLNAVSSPVKLEGMTDANDIPPLREWYRHNLDKFKAKHAAFYLGADGSGRRVPSINGLQTIWETPSLMQARQKPGTWYCATKTSNLALCNACVHR
jgi:hypothetical protein